MQKDLTLLPCYVVKHENYFAHGETLKEARQALQDKIYQNMDTEEKIEIFIKEFADINKKYSAKTFYDWHYKLTGSCEMGRNNFVENNKIDLENDKFTAIEFINMAENEYGSEIIKTIKERLS